MMHKSRRWCVTQAESFEQLAHNLTEHTWTKCTGFELAGYLFLNDSTSADGAQEYAVVRRPTEEGEPFMQVESVTFGWCSMEEALAHVLVAIRGKFDDQGQPVSPVIETPQIHKCGNCA